MERGRFVCVQCRAIEDEIARVERGRTAQRDARRLEPLVERARQLAVDEEQRLSSRRVMAHQNLMPASIGSYIGTDEVTVGAAIGPASSVDNHARRERSVRGQRRRLELCSSSVTLEV